MEAITQLLGGRSIEVTYRDGKKETVFVKELPIRNLEKFVLLQDNESGLVELLCDKPEGWADNLITESHEAIVELGGTLNFPILERWMARKGGSVERLAPVVQKTLAIPNLLPTSAPKPEPGGATPST